MSFPEPLKFWYLKYVPKDTEFTAYGYIRQFQQSLDGTIAELICKICLAFYTDIDGWDKEKMVEYIKLNIDTQTIENISNMTRWNDWQSAFGELICKYPNIYHWNLKIDALRGDEELMIGVVYHDCDYMEGIEQDGFVFWSWKSNTGCYREGDLMSAGYAKYLEDGDVVGVKLDLEQHTLSFAVNDEDYGVAIDKIPKNRMYGFVVSLGCSGNKVTLL